MAPTANTSVLRKTKLCKFALIGQCQRGERCVFAHSRGELRAKPDLSRTKLCPKLFSTGECTDTECRFAHELGELRIATACETFQNEPLAGETFQHQKRQLPAEASTTAATCRGARRGRRQGGRHQGQVPASPGVDLAFVSALHASLQAAAWPQVVLAVPAAPLPAPHHGSACASVPAPRKCSGGSAPGTDSQPTGTPRSEITSSLGTGSEEEPETPEGLRRESARAGPAGPPASERCPGLLAPAEEDAAARPDGACGLTVKNTFLTVEPAISRALLLRSLRRVRSLGSEL